MAQPERKTNVLYAVLGTVCGVVLALLTFRILPPPMRHDVVLVAGTTAMVLGLMGWLLVLVRWMRRIQRALGGIFVGFLVGAAISAVVSAWLSMSR